jgi:hypothetical protein
MARLVLPQVTLCAVDARTPALAAESLQRSLSQADFARAVLFTHGFVARPEGIEVVDVGPIRSGAEYSRFVLRELPAHVGTPFALVTQWDGFVIDASAWTAEFEEYDYVGALWVDPPAAGLVGNGGFSLRSRRLLDAGRDRRVEHEHPEDLMLAQRYRSLLEEEHGVRFAPPALARRFAYENEDPNVPTFGFHGPKNLAAVLDAATLQRWLEALPDEFFRGRDARRLARSLMRHGMAGLARRLVARRQAAGRTDLRTRLLGAAARLLDATMTPGSNR